MYGAHFGTHRIDAVYWSTLIGALYQENKKKPYLEVLSLLMAEA
jgi:hypothetical protein